MGVLSINDLHKDFLGKKALDGLSLHVNHGEMFALLGHNGAGKTTALNCIVGMIPFTSGQVHVNGFDVERELDLARQQLSICPQDNPLYDIFTVRQHLHLFASLRGVPVEQIQLRSEQVLRALQILPKFDALCTTLSGGQKRRLWVATALLGSTPLVFLDEPTSGMDPSSRRELWGFLGERRRQGESILFTTHYLDEADVQADKKAVMAKGKILANGTSMELKLKFGVGYHLRVEMASDATDSNAQGLATFITEHIQSAQEEILPEEERSQSESIRTERFTLPYHAAKDFGRLFSAMDDQCEALHISNYSIGITSLEEVFMNIGRRADIVESNDPNLREIEQESVYEQREDIPTSKKILALMKVRFIQVCKDRRSFMSIVLFPVLLNLLVLQYDLGSALYPAMAFALPTQALGQFLIKDRLCKCKYVSVSQGLSVMSYWFGTFLAHFASMSPVVALVFAIIHKAQPEDIDGVMQLLVSGMSVTYPITVILFAYYMSLFFDSPEVSAKTTVIFTIMAVYVPGIFVQTAWGIEDWRIIAKVVHALMSLANPLYSLPGFLLIIEYRGAGHTDIVSLTDCYIPVYGSVVSLVLVLVLLIRIEIKSFISDPGIAMQHTTGNGDEDVQAEGLQVQRNEAGKTTVKGLCHTYRTKVNGMWTETQAVRGITFGVRDGECFGLLGPNGAGKTTTLAILTGLVRPPSSGEVFVLNNDMRVASQMAKAYKQLGVCPQEDPLWDTVTGRDHLRFYGKVKGVPVASLEQKVHETLQRLGFADADANKPAGQYSGGMKRKLSLAIALIGQPPLLFLDEPSAAIDAAGKRHMWKVIKKRAQGQSVVLTTHSMEEAEALCGRIAIQVKGRLRCLGSPDHIKRRHGSGYQLEISTKQSPLSLTDQLERLKTFVRELSQDGQEPRVLEHHRTRCLFELPRIDSRSGHLTFGHVFTTLEKKKEEYGIVDYSLSQPSLEQVFIRFANEQEAPEVHSSVHGDAAV